MILIWTEGGAMGALRRYWEWETRLIRRDSRTRPGERAGLAIGLAVMVVVIVATVVPLTAR